MKVTSVDIFECNTPNPLLDPLFVRVNTDEGISGFGEIAWLTARANTADSAR